MHFIHSRIVPFDLQPHVCDNISFKISVSAEEVNRHSPSSQQWKKPPSSSCQWYSEPWRMDAYPAFSALWTSSSYRSFGGNSRPFLRTIIQKMARELLGTESLLLLAYQLVQFGSELELVSMHNNNANLSWLYSQSWR